MTEVGKEIWQELRPSVGGTEREHVKELGHVELWLMSLGVSKHDLEVIEVEEDKESNRQAYERPQGKGSVDQDLEISQLRTGHIDSRRENRKCVDGSPNNVRLTSEDWNQEEWRWD